MKIIGYIRVSTDRQEIGPEVQREVIGKRFPGVIWFEDIGVSGGAKLCDRPALAQAIIALQPGDMFVIYRLDRVARDLMTQMVVEEQVMKAGAKLVSCAGEGTESEGPEAKLFRQIIGAVAEFERAMIKMRTKAAMAIKRSRGEKLGGQTPFGFDSHDGKLVSNLDERAVIDQVLAYRAERMPIRKIIKVLNESGIPTKLGRKWNIRQIQLIIQRHGVS